RVREARDRAVTVRVVTVDRKHDRGIAAAARRIDPGQRVRRRGGSLEGGRVLRETQSPVVALLRVLAETLHAHRGHLHLPATTVDDPPAAFGCTPAGFYTA